MNDYIVSTNPAKKYEEIGKVEVTTKEQISKAVNDAKVAFEPWKELGFEGRKPYFEIFLSEINMDLRSPYLTSCELTPILQTPLSR